MPSGAILSVTVMMVFSTESKEDRRKAVRIARVHSSLRQKWKKAKSPPVILYPKPLRLIIRTDLCLDLSLGGKDTSEPSPTWGHCFR